MNQLVTILVPHYKTFALSKLCLRLLRKHTSSDLAHVIVIDNGSQDESTEYLRSLEWIELIERKRAQDESNALSHSRALDLALNRVTTPYVLSIHTDTLVTRDDWLPFLLEPMQRNSNLAGIGSWKLEDKPWHEKFAKSIGTFFQPVDTSQYLRSHCALYRIAVIKELGVNFSLKNEVAGKAMHEKMIEAGYEMEFLPATTLLNYMEHLNHATIVLNPELGGRAQTIKKGTKRINQRLAVANAVLADDSLDK
ncbi:MAG: glycosyltransferase [Gammaproteobacteria bacterium]|nr:glycosyltransferase [Gammaproteobacteria bacterium]